MFAIWFLAGLLPFVNFGRVVPVASFWPQWSSAALFMVIAFWGLKSRSSIRMSKPSYFDVSVLVTLTALCAQCLTGHVYSQAAALIAFGALCLALGLKQVVASSPLQQVEGQIDWWLKGVLCALFIHACSVVLGYFGWEFVYGSVLPSPVPLRALGAFGQANHLGVFAVLSIACIQYLFLKEKLSEIMAWVFFSMATFICAASFSRAALCVWFLVIPGAFFWFRQNLLLKNISAKQWYFFCSTGVAFVVVQLANFFWPLSNLFSNQQTTSSVIRAGRELSSASRLEQAWDAMELLKIHPLFGVGFEGFAGARFFELSGSLMETQVTVPHNLLLQLAVEFGFLGVLAGLALSLWVIILAARILFKSQSFSLLGLLAAQWVIGLYVYSMLEFPLLYCYFLFPFFMMAGVLALDSSSPNAAFSIYGGFRKVLLFLLLLGFPILGALAFDYHRLYNFVHNVKGGDISDQQSAAIISKLATIQSSSAFQFYANFIWLQVVELNDLFVQEKTEVAYFVVRGIPQYNTISRYVVYLVLAGRKADAVKILKNLSVRNSIVFANVVADLKKITSRSGVSPELKEFSNSY